MDTRTTTFVQPAITTKTVLFYLTIFALPMINHANQLIIGSAVNLMLFLGAKKLTPKELIPLAILPSLGAITNGALFGSFTMFLIYFAPFIWLGNYLMMFTFNKLENKSEFLKIIMASLLKAGLLFITAFIFVQVGLVPKIFLTAMGILQFATALAGGLLAIMIGRTKFFTNESESKNE